VEGTAVTRWTLCRICGHRINWIATRYAWVHAAHGADHPPIPT